MRGTPKAGPTTVRYRQYQKVRRFEVSVNDNGIQGVKIVYSQGCALENTKALHPWKLNGEVEEVVLEGALAGKVRNDAQVWSLDTSAYEQHNVGVMQLGEERHLSTELEQRPFV